MDPKKAGQKAPSPAPPRVPFMDISNSTALSTCTKTHDNTLSSHFMKGNVELRQELEVLKATLTEKEKIIEALKQNMEKLWLNCCRKSRQNDDIIQHNAQLYKDLMQTRDKLKILQHENFQLAAIHKISKSELQLKLTEALDHVKHLQAKLETSANGKASGEELNASSVVTNSLDSCVASGGSKLDCSDESKLTCREDLVGNLEDHPVLCRTASSRREGVSYKEPSLKVKIRPEHSTGGRSCKIIPKKTDCDDSTSERQISEDEDHNLATTSISSNSQATLDKDVSPPRSDTISISEENSFTSTTAAKAGKARSTQSMSMANAVDLSRKSSTDRPRRAVSSVGSYKERPLNSKMRRPD